MKLVKKLILFTLTVLVVYFFAFLPVHTGIAQSVPTCWFDYEYGCDPSGFVGCTACDDDGPVVKPKK